MAQNRQNLSPNLPTLPLNEEEEEEEEEEHEEEEEEHEEEEEEKPAVSVSANFYFHTKDCAMSFSSSPAAKTPMNCVAIDACGVPRNSRTKNYAVNVSRSRANLRRSSNLDDQLIFDDQAYQSISIEHCLYTIMKNDDTKRRELLKSRFLFFLRHFSHFWYYNF
jgi:hypothetical protein